jgi:ribosome maturation factor RimP
MAVATQQLAALQDLIEPSITAMGFRLVQIRMIGGENRQTLQIMAEPADFDREMDVDDCADVSRAVSAILDVEDPIAGAYLLEVSSPGIDRPLVSEEDYVRFAGHEARIELRRLVAGRRRCTGTVEGAQNGIVNIRVDGRQGTETVQIPLKEIERAKLRLTDELIEAALKKRKH